MIVEIILAALVVTAAGGAVAAYRRRRRERVEATPALMAPRHLVKGELLPNDVIVNLGADYLVEGVATFREGGKPILVIAWVTDGDSPRHFLVDLREQPRCVLAEARDGSHMGRSVPRIIQEGGLELRLTRRASVQLSCKGDCDQLAAGACEFGVYKGPGDRKAAVLISEDCQLYLVGKGVTEAGLQLLQGDLTERETD